MGNAMIQSKCENIRNLTRPVTSQSPGTQNGSKENHFSRKRNKKLKFDICTNFVMGNKMMESKCEHFQNLYTLREHIAHYEVEKHT